MIKTQKAQNPLCRPPRQTSAAHGKRQATLKPLRTIRRGAAAGTGLPCEALSAQHQKRRVAFSGFARADLGRAALAAGSVLAIWAISL